MKNKIKKLNVYKIKVSHYLFELISNKLNRIDIIITPQKWTDFKDLSQFVLGSCEDKEVFIIDLLISQNINEKLDYLIFTTEDI